MDVSYMADIIYGVANTRTFVNMRRIAVQLSVVLYDILQMWCEMRKHKTRQNMNNCYLFDGKGRLATWS